MRFARACVLLAIALTGCYPQRQPDCGDPAIGGFVVYQIVDAATGADWFAGSGRSPADSLRLLASETGPAQAAVRIGNRVQIGPLSAFGSTIGGDRIATHYLRFNSHDIDTVVVRLHYYIVSQEGPCPVSPALERVEVTYNGHPNGTYQDNVPSDSLFQFYNPGKLLRLRKR